MTTFHSNIINKCRLQNRAEQVNTNNGVNTLQILPHLILTNTLEVGTIIIFLLQIKKLRFTEVLELTATAFQNANHYAILHL